MAQTHPTIPTLDRGRLVFSLSLANDFVCLLDIEPLSEEIRRRSPGQGYRLTLLSPLSFLLGPIYGDPGLVAINRLLANVLATTGPSNTVRRCHPPCSFPLYHSDPPPGETRLFYGPECHSLYCKLRSTDDGYNLCELPDGLGISSITCTPSHVFCGVPGLEPVSATEKKIDFGLEPWRGGGFLAEQAICRTAIYQNTSPTVWYPPFASGPVTRHHTRQNGLDTCRILIDTWSFFVPVHVFRHQISHRAQSASHSLSVLEQNSRLDEKKKYVAIAARAPAECSSFPVAQPDSGDPGTDRDRETCPSATRDLPVLSSTAMIYYDAGPSFSEVKHLPHPLSFLAWRVASGVLYLRVRDIQCLPHNPDLSAPARRTQKVRAPAQNPCVPEIERASILNVSLIMEATKSGKTAPGKAPSCH
ncbi:hypothetical protein IF2G_08377 [Cordyceps javanica]|nr:hypothetical protein IF2G_08377 [Cordyceps javanica]